jgi:hypothetical protein
MHWQPMPLHSACAIAGLVMTMSRPERTRDTLERYLSPRRATLLSLDSATG